MPRLRMTEIYSRRLSWLKDSCIENGDIGSIEWKWSAAFSKTEARTRILDANLLHAWRAAGVCRRFVERTNTTGIQEPFQSSVVQLTSSPAKRILSARCCSLSFPRKGEGGDGSPKRRRLPQTIRCHKKYANFSIG